MKLEIVAPTGGSWSRFQRQGPLPPFDRVASGFAQALSEALLAEPRRYPEVVALGYWLRRANVRRLQLAFERLQGDQLRLARGMAFHIAPANVDTLFVYSWLLSLLVGNSNVVRLPSTDSQQLSLLLGHIAQVLAGAEFAPLRERTLLVRYGRDDALNRTLSARCDLRVLWGGDATVNRLRQVPLPPAARELCFVDKFSLALLDAETVLDAADLEPLATGFYNDAFGFGQMACSSPRLVVWRGDGAVVDRAQARFWTALAAKVQARAPEVPLAARMEKLVIQYRLAVDRELRIPASASAYINRLELDSLAALPVSEHCGGGLFYEARIATLADLRPLLSRKIQTLACFGVAAGEARAFLREPGCAGIDRVVPVGEALNFDAHWDGYDLLAEMSRELVVAL